MSALCPLCEAAGPIGEPCAARVCRRNGVHFIPEAEALTALAQQPSEREPLLGQLVGDFLVIGRLGKGGFGKVLQGLQRPHFKLRAAVKLIEFDGGNEPGTMARVLEKFDNEASALAVLQHPNIVRLLRFGTFQDQPYLAMEFVPGARTLQSEMNQHVVAGTSFRPQDVRHILEQVLNALEAAHAEQIIHRDIKPENIMLQSVVGDPWHVKLLDFGLAKVVAERRDTSLVFGTVIYMAPEQIEMKNLGPWTDLYAVGCIAFELFTGHRPFANAASHVILRQKLDEDYDPLERLGDDVELPAVLTEFLTRALARHPADRYRSCAELRAALGALFDATTATVAFSRDLNHLVDSEMRAQLRSEERRIAAKLQALEAEQASILRQRSELAAERVRLNSDRVQVSKSRQGLPRSFDTGAKSPTGTPSNRKRVLGLAALFLAIVAAVTAIGLALAGGKDAPPALASKDLPAVTAVERPHVASAPKPTPAPTPTPTPAPTPATLTITSTPAGVPLAVDGELVGVTPFELHTTLGAAHALELRPPGRPVLARAVKLTEPAQRLDLEVPRVVAAKPAKPQPATPERPKAPEAKPSLKPIFVDD